MFQYIAATSYFYLKTDMLMREEAEKAAVVKNGPANRFELPMADHKPFIEFEEESGIVWLKNTVVPASIARHGVGSVMVLKTLELIKSEDKKVIAECPFVNAVIRRHPDWKEILVS
ncbi:MAG: GNAT family N-acetyltransferase [Edaphocola sp.]